MDNEIEKLELEEEWNEIKIKWHLFNITSSVRVLSNECFKEDFFNWCREKHIRPWLNEITNIVNKIEELVENEEVRHGA